MRVIARVYTSEYGWIWMPYGDQYAYEGTANDAYPYSYVYYPSYGWTWLATRYAVAQYVTGIEPWSAMVDEAVKRSLGRILGRLAARVRDGGHGRVLPRPFRYAAQGAVDVEAEVIAIAMARPPPRVRASCDLPSAPSDHFWSEEMAM